MSTYQECLDAHYRRNDHHPAHFRNPAEEMSLECRMELTCDLLGCVMGWGSKQQKNLNVAQCRALIEQQDWEPWRLYAVKENLPPPADDVPELEPRWYGKIYPARELDLLLTGTEDIECVRDYLDDTFKHKSGVFRAWREIVDRYDERFRVISERIQNHDLDKFRPDMIRGYTMQYSKFASK